MNSKKKGKNKINKFRERFILYYEIERLLVYFPTLIDVFPIEKLYSFHRIKLLRLFNILYEGRKKQIEEDFDINVFLEKK
jgi:hypothetical protein